MTKLPGNTGRTGEITQGSGASAVDAFLQKAAQTPAVHEGNRGRLVFALDATMSRQPTWDIAQGVQGRMFETAAKLGGLDVQLVYFRGFMECKASRFIADGAGLGALMGKIDVRGGQTQIAKVLRHVLGETRKQRVGALVYVGDAMEEGADELCQLAGELSLLGVKAFMFHEGHDSDAGAAFREIARLTGGAYAAFDNRAPARLVDLLAAAAAYAAGGRAALERQALDGGEAARALLTQMK
ncbi:MAG: VWA domain-containing protein [Hyphomicrobiales bacterium]|nr:VWA domain-containing protein [Hyphomicrobiales bacterium]